MMRNKGQSMTKQTTQQHRRTNKEKNCHRGIALERSVEKNIYGQGHEGLKPDLFQKVCLKF